jgi:PadR family transcriptional regulator, regulatory protein PadR
MKGVLPLLVLRVLSKKPNYGYQILAELRFLSKGVLDYNDGALYPVLYQLEREGYVESYTESADGRLRRFYQLTEKGHTHHKRAEEEWVAFVKSVQLVLNKPSL